MRVLASHWFSSARGTIGVVKAFDEDTGAVCYRISPVDGFTRAVDENCVMAFGASFPEAAGEVIFGKDES